MGGTLALTGLPLAPGWAQPKTVTSSSAESAQYFQLTSVDRTKRARNPTQGRRAPIDPIHTHGSFVETERVACPGGPRSSESRTAGAVANRTRAVIRHRGGSNPSGRRAARVAHGASWCGWWLDTISSRLPNLKERR